MECLLPAYFQSTDALLLSPFPVTLRVFFKQGKLQRFASLPHSSIVMVLVALISAFHSVLRFSSDIQEDWET